MKLACCRKVPPLGCQTKEARVQSLKRKLLSGKKFHRKYREFMENLIERGNARKLTEIEAARRSGKTWYLPHHGVFHPRKKDTVLAVLDAAAMQEGVSLNNQLHQPHHGVFHPPKKDTVLAVLDAAAMQEGVSLNNQLHQGPDLANSLLGVLLRFRQYPIALVADIEGMFNQVKVPPEDSDASRFLWWENNDLESPSEFQMTSHIFGAKDSPSCANFCLKRAAEDSKGKFSEEAVSALTKDFYVDDFVKPVGTVNEASLLSKVGFKLMKCMSNSRAVLSEIPDGEPVRPTLDLDLENLPVERTLGVQWDVEKDAFLFKVRVPYQPSTKPGILSAVSSLHNPMGFVCPVILEAKKILQTLWKLNQGWDDEIPEDLQKHWNKWKSELSLHCLRFKYRDAA